VLAEVLSVLSCNKERKASRGEGFEAEMHLISQNYQGSERLWEKISRRKKPNECLLREITLIFR